MRSVDRRIDRGMCIQKSSVRHTSNRSIIDDRQWDGLAGTCRRSLLLLAGRINTRTQHRPAVYSPTHDDRRNCSTYDTGYLHRRRRLCFWFGLFVCLSVGLLANLWTDFDDIFWRGRAWLKDQVIQFWWRSGSRFGSGSPKSEIRILRIGGGLCSLSAFLVYVFTWAINNILSASDVWALEPSLFK